MYERSNVNKKYVSEFLEGEIKEISERWGRFMINKLAIEKQQETWKEFTKEEVDKCLDIQSVLDRKKSDNAKKTYLATLPKEDFELFTEHTSRRTKKRTLEDAEKGLEEFEEFLEVVNALKILIDSEESTTTTGISINI